MNIIYLYISIYYYHIYIYLYLFIYLIGTIIYYTSKLSYSRHWPLQLIHLSQDSYIIIVWILYRYFKLCSIHYLYSSFTDYMVSFILLCAFFLIILKINNSTKTLKPHLQERTYSATSLYLDFSILISSLSNWLFFFIDLDNHCFKIIILCFKIFCVWSVCLVRSWSV